MTSNELARINQRIDEAITKIEVTARLLSEKTEATAGKLEEKTEATAGKLEEKTEATAGKLFVKLDDIAGRVVHIESSCPAHTERLVKIERFIFGNGNVGLSTRVDRMERSARAVWAIASGVMTLVGAAAGSVATWLLK